VIWLSTAGVVLLIFIVFFASLNSTQKTMVAKEQKLSAKYTDNQNVLSAYRATIKEALGVANTSTAAQDKIIEDAIKGRYDGATGANPIGGAAFSAIIEAYPNVNVATYEKVQTAVFAGREAFKNQQTALLELLRDYNTWRNAGFIHRVMVSMVGAPSSNLEAAIGTDVVTGQAAMARMKLIVITADTKDAFNSGEDTPLDLGPSSAPTQAQ
jgi:hypothetical protein